MLRDMKLFRRNAGKKPEAEEIENVPVNSTEGVSEGKVVLDPIRPPLNTIPVVENESGTTRSKTDRTPQKGASAGWGLRTPEKQGGGVSARTKFGWVQRSDVGNGDEGKSEVSHLPRGGGMGNGGLPNRTPRSVRATGREVCSQSESNSTQSTPNKSVTKPQYSGIVNNSRPPVSMGARGGNFAALSKGYPMSCSSPMVVNTVEVPHFELKEDPSFWMDHNVQVLIRIRPLNTMERSLHGYNRCLKQENAQTIAWIGQPETRFTFDHVACETVNQEMLFRVAGLPMVENCMSGYNSCMFAYGQTGSGKTHTMLGEIDDLKVRPSANRGMTPRIFEFLFARIRAEEESRRDENLKYYCKCSFLEIYNEQITDLLDPSSSNLLLREDTKNGVYVENLTEFEVHTVNDIVRLLMEGAANRKVAATNMNRESSRSHSVFTCVIESRWEKESATNLRFARLNLVDLAGSERQKTSGAEGERLKEAANINKSLSTLGHVIMLLVDVAHGKQRHIPYRDSRLTFLLQESLGGNSKTMIIANVSPSICCAAETLSTLKFAQRAKLIQNNAIVNEDASGDISTLQHQIRLLKEEISVLKSRNVSRTLSFSSKFLGETDEEESIADAEVVPETVHESNNNSHRSASLRVVRMSTKQLKSLETTLAGALRREQMADTHIKQLEAEIEQLNRLVHQREDDSRCTKMMLKFREDKIQRMESLVSGCMPSDTYLLQENNAYSEELQLLRAKADRNPEVTRFALENIRLLEKLRKFQDFYEEGEREMLLAEVAELRDQLLQFIDGNTENHNHLNLDMPFQVKETNEELDECRNNLSSCLEINSKLTREIDDLRTELDKIKSEHCVRDVKAELVMEASRDARAFESRLFEAIEKEKEKLKHETTTKHVEEIMNLQLEMDIIKIILQEEKSSLGEVEKKSSFLSSDLEMANKRCSQISRQCEDVENKLKDARSVIEALESQQIMLINELDSVRDNNNQYLELLSKQDQEICVLRDELCSQELRKCSCLENLQEEDTPLQAKLKRMQASLEKAKRLNTWYQSDQAFQTSHEEEMDEVRKQVEGETAEVIVFLQEELTTLQQQVKNCNIKELKTQEKLLLLQDESKDLRERLYITTQDKESLAVLLGETDEELRKLSEEWEKLAFEMEEVIVDGHEALQDASSQVESITSSFPHRTWIREQVGKMLRNISEKELLIEELQRCLEEAQNIRTDMDWKLKSLRGAALAITEAQEHESSEKENEILMLTKQLGEKTSLITDLEDKIKISEDQVRKAEVCATAAFVIVNRLSEMNSDYFDVLKNKDIQLNEAVELNSKKDVLLQDQVVVIEEGEKQIQVLRAELGGSKESYLVLKVKLIEEEERVRLMEKKLAEVEADILLKTREKLEEFKLGVSTLSTNVNEYTEQDGGTETVQIPGKNGNSCRSGDSCGRIVMEASKDINENDTLIGNLSNDATKNSFKVPKDLESGRACKDVNDRDRTIILLRKEIESALESLREVQAQMVQLHLEKEEIRNSEKQSRKNLESLASQFLTLQEGISSSERNFELRLMELDDKLHKLDERAQEVNAYRSQKGEVLELELSDAKMVAVQKSAEAACMFAKFEESQETIKEADVMVNALMAANERAKLEIQRLKEMEASLKDKRDMLFDEVQNLQSSNFQKDQQYDDLEKQYCSELSDTRNLVLSLENIVVQVQTTVKEDFLSILSEVRGLKKELMSSLHLTGSWLEDIWSEIIVKDCAVSALHLCHMGVLLEAVNGLNAENGLLHHGLCESNSVIGNLKQHNFKAKRELEMCRILKGKLLVDIKSSFDRISKKEDETGKLGARLSSFEQKILELQLQEEFMLDRSNSMSSELSLLIKEIGIFNTNALRALDQEKLLKDKEEIMNSQVESITVDLTAKKFESLIMASELQNMALQKADLEGDQEKFSEYVEILKEELILVKVEAEMKTQMNIDAEAEAVLLKGVIGESDEHRNDLSQKLKQCRLKLSEVEQAKMVLEESLNGVFRSNDHLKDEVAEVMEINERLSTQVRGLETEKECFIKDLEMKEIALEASVCELRTELSRKDAEVNQICSIEEENTTLKNEVTDTKADYCRVLDELQEKISEFESSCGHMHVLEQENQKLQEKICSLETCITSIQTDFDMKNEEVVQLQHSQSVTAEKLILKDQELRSHIAILNSMKEENGSLKSELASVSQKKDALLFLLNLNQKSFVNSVVAVKMTENRVFQFLDDRNITLVEKMFQDICEDKERASKLIMECESLETFTEELISENLSFQAELKRKDEILNGLLFDLSLLQESASSAKDQKDDIEEMAAVMESLEDDLAQRSAELDEAVAHGEMLEAQLQEKIGDICALELDVSKERELLKLVRDENMELRCQMEDVLARKSSLEEELNEKNKVMERLEEQIFQMDSALGETNTLLEDLKNNLNEVTAERDSLESEVLVLREKLDMAQAVAEETQAIAIEARQIAELRKNHAEEKEEEVKLLESSVEELEDTINALENKVEVVKGEAEKQRLQREELEVELQTIRNQMLYTESQSQHEERKSDMKEAQKKIEDLEKSIAEKDAEISQCRVYISELNLHAEAQANDYKQKFRALEAMAEKVKPEPSSSYAMNSSSTKIEKSVSKPRGSGSPFKCIGLGLAQQISSEKDEELNAGRHRIEELEALAASRQKEIFMLNARLATAESMTHDVIRDLLGVKLDMNNYAALLDHHQVHRISEKARSLGEEPVVKEQEVANLRQELNKFIEERQGWLEEINHRQAEMVALQIASEKLRQRDQFLTTENEMLKRENVNHKKKVMELDDEVKKLSGQQNLQQRIHHHAKIKDENNWLKTQNEELSAKLRRSETILTRLKEELARYRASNGRNPFIDFDEERRLNNKLKETEEERLQLAQKLLSLCTSILKAAGITRPVPDASLSDAEEALTQLKDRIVSLEREVQDLTFKNRIFNERARLSELKQQSSPLSSRRDEHSTTPGRMHQTPFLSALDR